MKIKQCKGFDGKTPCSLCQRQNNKCKETLVKSLAIDPVSKKETCIHYVYDKNQIKDRNKIK